MIAVGDGAVDALRNLASASGRELLHVPHADATVWGWLGGTRCLTVARIDRIFLADSDLGNVMFAVGEPARGIDGWRLTHQQAQAAHLVSLHRPRLITRYAEEMLLAAALHDETLVQSLQHIYLSPLRQHRDGGVRLRDTLRAYFNARRNASSAGLQLGLSRQAIEGRLRTAEDVLGRPLDTCLLELELALLVDELIDSSGHRTA